eukprot:221768-Amphidinium_carterae.2
MTCAVSLGPIEVGRKEVDEGVKLKVGDQDYGNCCLAISLGRALTGSKAEKAEVEAWATSYLQKLSTDNSAKLAKNKACVGDMLYYCQEVIAME